MGDPDSSEVQVSNMRIILRKSIRLTTSQRKRTTVCAGLPSSIWWRTRCFDHLLPHGPSKFSPSTIPCRRRDQSGNGPSQRTNGTLTHGRYCLCNTHLAVLPYYAKVAAEPDIPSKHEGPLYRKWRIYAGRSRQARLRRSSSKGVSRVWWTLGGRHGHCRPT